MTDRDNVRRTARYLLSQAGHAQPRIPPFAELVELAREYVEIAGDGTDDRRHQRLGDAGPVVYVTTDAARKYAGHSAAGDLDGARLELTTLLHDAVATATPGDWRIRQRGGLDIEAHVSRELVAGRPVHVVRDVVVHRGTR